MNRSRVAQADLRLLITAAFARAPGWARRQCVPASNVLDRALAERLLIEELVDALAPLDIWRPDSAELPATTVLPLFPEAPGPSN